MKLISVVMVTYNHEKYIEQAIESVLMQEGNFEIELLIGNDKSPDNTEKILKKYENSSRIKIFNREKNLGATSNLWDLFRKAKGKYIALLEGDDYWITKDKLQKQIDILEKNENISLCYTNSYVVDENNKIFGEKKTIQNEIKNFMSLMSCKTEIPVGTILFRNVFLNSKNLIKEEKLLKSSNIIGDICIFSLLIKIGIFKKLEEITGAYRYITDSKKSTSYSSQKEIYKLFETYKAYRGIADYYEMNTLKRFFFLGKREYQLLKEIRKNKFKHEDYLGNITTSKRIEWLMYKILKPLDNLFWSVNKKIYRK